MTERNETPKQQMVQYHPNETVGNQGTLKALVTGSGFQQAVRRILPKHLDPERMCRMVLAAASRNPTLLSCTQGSLLKGVIEASTLGLDCGGLLGRGYLVPFKNGRLSREQGATVYEAQFIPGYLGLCDLARRSGEVVKIEAKAVYDSDEFEYEEGLDPKLRHVPSHDPQARREAGVVKEDGNWKDPGRFAGNLRWVYAIAEYANGTRQFLVMSVAEVETHRLRSRAAGSGPWVTDYEAMALKTVTRGLCKWLPQSPDLARALEIEDAAADRIYTREDSGVQIDELDQRDTTKRLEERFTAPTGEEAPSSDEEDFKAEMEQDDATEDKEPSQSKTPIPDDDPLKWPDDVPPEPPKY